MTQVDRVEVGDVVLEWLTFEDQVVVWEEHSADTPSFVAGVADATPLELFLLAAPGRVPPAALVDDQALRASRGRASSLPRPLTLPRVCTEDCQGWVEYSAATACDSEGDWDSYWGGLWSGDSVSSTTVTSGDFEVTTPKTTAYATIRAGGCAEDDDSTILLTSAEIGDTTADYEDYRTVHDNKAGRYWWFYPGGTAYWLGAYQHVYPFVSRVGVGASWRDIILEY
jgi:hypothetical protein